jgi:molybdenum cofactor guanylyltransferase
MTKRLPNGLILAGGKSSRMGSDKISLPFGSGTLLTRMLDRLAPQVTEVAVNGPPSLQLPKGVRHVPDTLPGQPGPLAGVLAGLRDLSSHRPDEVHLLTVPSDAPFFPEDLARLLMSAASGPETVAIAASGGRVHPVFGLWPVSLANDLEHWLRNSENRRMSDYLGRQQVVTVEWAMVSTTAGLLDPFMNLNTPEELGKARRFLEILP